MRLTLLKILEDRYECKALIITSQLPFNTGYEYIGEPTLANAIMDRMSAKAHRIELQGQITQKKI